jgi:two-component system, response regulator RegA
MTARILVVDDDRMFAAALVRSFSRRGFVAYAAHDMIAALQALDDFAPSHVVLDLKLGADDGLIVLARMRERSPDLPILLLTGYASITTAVESIKRGAMNYLPKPADAAAILRALGLTAPLPAAADPMDKPLAWNRVEWEHIQRVLHEHGGNIAATARALGMHRRTLQRKLHKRAPQPLDTD